jgi:hypothetical protein
MSDTPIACILVSSQEATLLVGLPEKEAALAAFALEFGIKCGVFSAINEFIEDFKEPFERALKDIADIAGRIYTEIREGIRKFQYLLETGIQAIQNYINEALLVVDTVIQEIDALVNQVVQRFVGAINAVASAFCNLLNQAITGLPSSVVLTSPTLIARRAITKADTPAEFLREMVNNSGIREFQDQIDDKLNQIRNFGRFPDLSVFVCTP